MTISDTEFYFRNVFYFLRRRGRDNIQNMTVIFSGNNYVLYSVLNVSNVSLNIILREVYSHSESNNFTSDLENKLKLTYFKTVNSLRNNIHNKEDISHSLTQNCSVHSHLNHLFSVSTFLYFTLAMFLLSRSIYTGRDTQHCKSFELCVSTL